MTCWFPILPDIAHGSNGASKQLHANYCKCIESHLWNKSWHDTEAKNVATTQCKLHLVDLINQKCGLLLNSDVSSPLLKLTLLSASYFQESDPMIWCPFIYVNTVALFFVQSYQQPAQEVCCKSMHCSGKTATGKTRDMLYFWLAMLPGLIHSQACIFQEQKENF